MKKLRTGNVVIVVLVLGILAVGAYFLVGSGLFLDAPAAASMTPEELAAENKALMKQFQEAGRSIGGMAVLGKDKAALEWLEKYAPDGHPTPLPDDPKAANEGLKRRIADAKVIFEAMQASEKRENPWLRQYYGEENEQTLKKLGIKSLKVKEAQDDEIKKFLKPARTTAKALKGFLSKHRHEIAQDKGYNLASVLDTPEHILGVVKPYLEEEVDYSDSRFVFHGDNKEWWVGYKLDGLSDELRQKIVEGNIGLYRDLYKAPDKGKSLMNYDALYDGGDIVFLNVNSILL